MTSNDSSATHTYVYQPTIINNTSLISRLANQIAFLNDELKRSSIEFKTDPPAFVKRSIREVVQRFKKLLSTPNVAPACVSAVAAITCVVLLVIVIERTGRRSSSPDANSDDAPTEMVLLNVAAPDESTGKSRIGKDGAGRVGFQKDKGEGSGPVAKLSQGGGGGGDHNPAPPQVGKLPPPSTILAAIPTTPPINHPALPVAGIDIDPALWKDIKTPVYGDPKSKSETQSKGPGEGDGIGTNRGLGIGSGDGPGYGPGADGNTGLGQKQQGCCGTGGASDGDPNRTFSGNEAEQRARLLLKPEPQYTEEARKNQTTGRVTLRVVFASTGDVVQIRAVHTLPFGLTERAIAAARQIKFVPAMKGGRPVSVFMQLEYNFNLY